MSTTSAIPGYTYGSDQVAKSSLSAEAFASLRQTVLFSDEDVRYLRMAGEVLEDQIDDVLDLWYGFVGSHPHLVAYFSTSGGEAIPEYLSRVRVRFAQWIRDTTQRNFDQQWLDYQYEIALRHHSSKKNQVDGISDAPPIIPLRYMVAFIAPITLTIKGFLSKRGHSSEDVEKMYAAWFKSVVLQVTLWVQPYANSGEF
jgi:hypothetical protein